MSERSGRLIGHWQPTSSRWQGLTLWLVALVVLVLIGVSLSLSRRGFETDAPAGVPAGELPRQHTNGDAGYSFRYPDGWSVTEEGSMTRILDPGRNAVVSFGFLDASDHVLAASDDLLARIQESYTEVEINDKRSRADTIGGGLTVIREGTAVNSRGIEVRFLAAAVEGCPNHGVIMAFQRRGAGSTSVEPIIRRVLDSYDLGCPE